MPKGYPNPQPVPPPSPAPMILIEPAAEGTPALRAGASVRFNAYGLDPAEIIDLLRRSLLHLVAQQSGIEIITLDVPARAAVVASRPAAPSKPKTAQPGRNGSKPAPRGSRVLVADHTDWEPDSDQ